ncbi:hypothetical protein PENFLA_c071G10470 [Penicillium flavigenum]|uniref:D-aminoacyl-tRNA deacylase n=1 Tax=Penicillium flavigenum TaxID=254877 RepID=A0A1V6SD45_9EURO|nr:hypothetical protein PENFLA_c071G10470 [Penicillium flavigenum]
MKAVLQRVLAASITIDGHLVKSIQRGMLVLITLDKKNTERDVNSMVARILRAELWPSEKGDGQGKWERNIQDIGGELLCVSQYTLHNHLKRDNAHDPTDDRVVHQLYAYLIQQLSSDYQPEKVKNGTLEALTDAELMDDTPIQVEYHSANAVVTIKVNTRVSNESKESEGDNKTPPSKEKDLVK